MNAWLIVLAVLGLVASFLLAAGESAVFRMSRVRAEELADEERTGSRSLTKVVADAPAYLAVLNFMRVVSESTTAVVTAIVVDHYVTDTWRAVAIAIAVMAVLSFGITGVSPRTLGRQHYDAVALLTAPMAVFFRRVLGPVAHSLIALSNAVTPGRGYREGPFQNEAELRDLVDIAGESSLIEAEEREMIHSVFELGDTVAREVMVPRIDMVTVEGRKSLRAGLSLCVRSGFSRIPVVGEDSDDVLGLLYLKDVVRMALADPEAVDQPVTEAMRPMHFVPESKPVDDLLREMQRDQNHFAIVVDEYGGTAGLVTIEDILEEIVGEIDDEYDKETPSAEPLPGGDWLVPAAMDIDDLADLLDVEIDEEEVDTVGGLLTKAIGRVPITGSHGQVAGLVLTAEKMSGRRHRVATVRVHIVTPAESADTQPTARGTGPEDPNPTKREE